MARKRRRRRKAKKTTKATVRAIVKKEVGKTRETQKLVSYLSWSSIPPLIDGGATLRRGLTLSLTGGVNPQIGQTVQSPASYTDKTLFVLLPSANVGGTFGGQQAGQGGMAMQSNAAGDTSAAIGGIHQLEGRQCYLKNWYARIIVSNNNQQVQSPRPSFVRMIVFETRRPLANDNLAQQVFLQNHAVSQFNTSVAAEPQSVNSYLNTSGVKKIYADRLIKLTGPFGQAPLQGGSSNSSYCTKLKVKINKKAHWTYIYPTQRPLNENEENLIYQGPFIYAIFCSNQDDPDEQPAIALSTMLTFYDD